ncbi:hypothetical protein GH714_025745 [Hevea brasiliensis]|uniref:Leucine-rich repeat-containing N-terminal plant-type domain-containing protein n=1 Tax=Hevea brasiliensis TaxID=3981 RepID=A0A6A6KUC7_HEVBR|nr:hypothetical protein GH714_025745 [Hevea brasiliensis]
MSSKIVQTVSHLGWDYEEYYMKSTFGGKISPSLLNLKHLRYFDLSNNDFGGIQIPKFLGSMKSLRYLNLSGAGFGGMVPHELGNLSNLHCLNLNGAIIINMLRIYIGFLVLLC